MEHIDHDILKDMQANAPDKEKVYWKKKLCTQNKEGLWKSTEGKFVLPKGLFRYAAILSHGLDQGSTVGMVDVIQKIFTAYGFTNYSKKKWFSMFCVCTV